MPGGTGDEVPVAATSNRSIVWPSKMSPLGCHHSGATPVAGPGGTTAVPVQSQELRPFQVTDRVGRGHGGQQQADAEADRDGQDDQPGDGLAAAAEHQPQPEPDHGSAPVSVLTLPSRTTTSRSA